MLNLFGDVVVIHNKKSYGKDKTKWKNSFQKWSDRVSQDETTPLGKCGYGYICDYCTNNYYGRPCVRALNELLKENKLSIDYKNLSEEYYKKVFNGDF